MAVSLSATPLDLADVRKTQRRLKAQLAAFTNVQDVQRFPVSIYTHQITGSRR